MLIDLLSVLQFVHSHNVIHRDIKPENIISREVDKKLVLVDFGASKIMPKTQRRTVTGTIIGSAEYCAPEQSMGKAKLASDLYSLGVVCLHLLTQMSPFDLSQKLYPVSCIHYVKLQKNLLPESACIFPIILISFCYKGLFAYTHDFLFN